MKTLSIFRWQLCLLVSVLLARCSFGAVPIITSFVPGAAASGTAVVIAGSNFGAAPSNNIVYFGAVRATVTTVTSSNLTVTVPAGATYAPITVLVNGFIGYSKKPFQPEFSGNGAAFDASSLGSRIDFPTPSGPLQVAIGDLDGDGRPDVVVANAYSHNISFFRNLSSGGTLASNSLSERIDLPAFYAEDNSDSPYGVTLGDVDGDGRLDIVTFDRLHNKIVVYRNIATPGILDTNSFAPAVFFDVGANPRGVVVADIDGDGRPDIVFSVLDDGAVSILRNTGTPGSITTNSFAPPVNFPAGSGPNYTLVADLDGDGKPDIATVNASDSTISIFRNLSTPGVIDTNSLAPRVDLPAPATPIAIAAGDLDGDGKADLVVGGYFGPLSVYRNTSTAGSLTTHSFAPEVDFDTAGRSHTIALADLNGDGKLDIALVTEINDALSLFENVSTPGTFTSASLAPRVDYAAGYNAWGVAVGDLDGDGRPDILFGNAYAATMSLYQNVSPFSSTGPIITQQPTNRTVSAGSVATFSVTATGSPTLYYQWYRNAGDLIPGATSSTLTLSNVQPSDAGAYFVFVTNSVGFAQSSNAVLTVTGGTNANTAPVITKQPTNQTVSAGSVAKFSVTATGSPTLFYQWYRNVGDLIPGAVSSTLTLSNVQPSDAGTYFVLVTNLYGFAISSNAVLTVNGFTTNSCTPPPSNIAAWWRAENNADDSVNANNGTITGGISYGPGKVGQAFQFDGTTGYISVPASPTLNIGTGSGLTIECWIKPDHLGPDAAAGRPIVEYDTPSAIGVMLWFENNYTLFANIGDTSNQIHTIKSAPGTIVTNALQHVAVTYDKASGNCLLYVNGVQVTNANFGNITPQTTTSLSIGRRSAVGVAGEGSLYNGLLDELSLYSRALSQSEIQAIYNAGSNGKCPGGTSNSAPVITKQPTNQTVSAGSVAKFSVTATGSSTLFYQWYRNAGDLIPGSVSSTLTLSNVQPGDAGTYFVLVTNLYGFAISSNATLTVSGSPTNSCTPPPSGLVAWWKAEGNGDDSTGTNNGTLLGGLGFTNGEVGQAFNFNNGDDGVQVPASPSLAVQSFTIEAWLNPADVSDFHPILEYGADTGLAPVQFLYGWNDPGGTTPGALFGILRGTNDTFLKINSPGGILPANQWSHVAITFDYATQRGTLYLNGENVGSSTFSGVLTPQTALPVHLGYRPNTSGEGRAGDRLSGNLDEVSIYSRVLSQSEIQAIYNAGANGKCPGSTPQLPPVITKQPTNQITVIGGTASFSVTATGTAPLSYQWHGPSGNISGGTNATLVLSNVQTSNAGPYSVTVSNPYGTTNSASATLTVTTPRAVILVVSTSATSGGSVDVPISLNASGVENALSFSLNFDPARLTYSDVSLAGSATNGFLLANTSQAGAGRVGLQLALPSGQTFNRGTQQVIRVTFTSSPLTGTQVVTAVKFTNQPIAQLVSDAQGQSVLGTFVNGTVTLLPSAYEGDASPVPAGDGNVNLFDWVQVGRFVAGLDVITNGSEFQKVDCAPRSTLGDGHLTTSDWVQAGRYAAGLDPLTFAGGPTGPIGSNTIASAQPHSLTPREVTIGNGVVVKGMTVTVPVNLAAQGDETAMAFSLSFDPSVLQYVSAAKGSATGSAVLNVNANQAAAGKLAIALCLPAGGSHFAPGTDEVAVVTFMAVGSSTNNTVAFVNQPVLCSIASTNAIELTANYSSSSIIVNPQPSVGFSHSAGNSVLSWPVWAGDFTLQAAGSLTPPIHWTNVPMTLQTNGDQIQVTLPTPDGQTFFRLYHP